MKRLLLILLLLPLTVLAQDITGIWVGYLKTTDNTLPFELAISGQSKENFTGYSHTTFTFNGVDNIGVKTIVLKNKKGNVSLEDGELVFSNYTTPPKRVKLFGKLYLKVSDSLMVMTGTFFTRTLDFREETKNTFIGTVYLRKQKGFPKTKLIAQLEEMDLLHTLSFAPQQYKKKEEPVVAVTSPTKPPEIEEKPKEKEEKKEKEPRELIAKTKADKKSSSKEKQTIPKPDTAVAIKKPIVAAPAAAIAKRKTEIIRNVYFRSDSLVLSVYDNGTVDGDTVSIVLNGNVVVAKQGLTSNAIRTTVHITPGMGDSLQLIMYAENLGAIPPNTGVLVIQDGNARNEIRFEGDFQKSSGIVLRRRR